MINIILVFLGYMAVRSVLFYFYKEKKIREAYELLGDISKTIKDFFKKYPDDTFIEASEEDVNNLANMFGEIYYSMNSNFLAIPIFGEIIMIEYVRRMNATFALLNGFINSVKDRDSALTTFENISNKLYECIKGRFNSKDEAISYVNDSMCDMISKAIKAVHASGNKAFALNETQMKQFTEKIKDELIKKIKNDE